MNKEGSEDCLRESKVPHLYCKQDQVSDDLEKPTDPRNYDAFSEIHGRDDGKQLESYKVTAKEHQTSFSEIMSNIFLLKSKYKLKLQKFVIVVFIFISFLLVKHAGVISEADYDKPKDRLFDATNGVNKYLNDNKDVARIVQILACLILDSVFILVLAVFVSKSESLRTPVSMVLFYLIRAALQMLQTSPFPVGMYWEETGFPTIVNIYGRQSDFFYSGHIGFLVLCTLEFFSCKYTRLGCYGIFS